MSTATWTHVPAADAVEGDVVKIYRPGTKRGTNHTIKSIRLIEAPEPLKEFLGMPDFIVITVDHVEGDEGEDDSVLACPANAPVKVRR